MVDMVKAAATAKRLIESTGTDAQRSSRLVDLLKINRTPDNPAQPWRGVTGPPTAPEGGDVQTGVRMAFVPAAGSGFGRDIIDIPGELRTQVTQFGLLASTSVPGVDVEKFDAIRDDDGTILKILTRSHLRPGTTSIMYVLALGGASA